MGWERKRGKLHEFNRLLRGAQDTSFSVQIGNVERLRSMRYVITLDSDTDLPLDVGREARRHAGASAEPCAIRRALGRVTEGYGVLQPRVAIGAVSASASTFAEVFSGHVGLDPYTTAVSDVYQDLFGEGSYVGKGIYDIDAFERALHNRVPGERAAEPRPVRRAVRAGRALHRPRGGRRFSEPLPDVGCAAAPMGARRLAAAAVARRQRSR